MNRRRWRMLKLGLPTLLGLARRGYFIPYRYLSAMPAPPRRYASLEALLASHRDSFTEFLTAMQAFEADLAHIGEDRPPQPRWDQDWFPRLDALAAYTFVRLRRPGLIVEIGSGHSTRFMARAVADGGLETRISAIDPAPRASIEGLSPTVEVVRQTLQEVPPGLLRDLSAGDVLFIDSSHIAMPGSDVDLLLHEILPCLPAGVLVHVHDVFLPDAYPAEWEWRGYNEQNVVASVLLSGGYQPLFASHFAATRMAEDVDNGIAGRLPLPDGAYESSLWLEKTDGAFTWK